MFANIGWAEFFIIVLAGLVILGPERLPHAFLWVAKALRTVREYLASARKQFQDEFGTDLNEFAEPLAQFRELRSLSPRAVITRHLLDGDDGFLTSIREVSNEVQDAVSGSPAVAQSHPGVGGAAAGATSGAPAPGTPASGAMASRSAASAAGAAPPAPAPGARQFDPDAT